MNEELEEVSSFNYLGSVITKKGRTEDDVKTRIGKATGAFNSLSNVWNSKRIKTNTKIKIFKSNVMSVLLYGCESWKTTKDVTKKLQVFVNRGLRKILGIYWPKVISNKDLWNAAGVQQLENKILERKWRWIGHTLRKPNNSIPKEALEWNPQGKRKRGRPATTWRRSVHNEAIRVGKTWEEMKKEAPNRVRWRKLVTALCSSRNEEDK